MCLVFCAPQCCLIERGVIANCLSTVEAKVCPDDACNDAGYGVTRLGCLVLLRQEHAAEFRLPSLARTHMSQLSLEQPSNTLSGRPTADLQQLVFQITRALILGQSPFQKLCAFIPDRHVPAAKSNSGRPE